MQSPDPALEQQSIGPDADVSRTMVRYFDTSAIVSDAPGCYLVGMPTPPPLPTEPQVSPNLTERKHPPLREFDRVWRARLRPQVAQMVRAMREAGVSFQIVGSYAKPNGYFIPGSDLNVCIMAHPGLKDAHVWEIAYRTIRDAPIDMRFVEDMSAIDLIEVRLLTRPATKRTAHPQAAIDHLAGEAIEPISDEEWDRIFARQRIGAAWAAFTVPGSIEAPNDEIAALFFGKAES